MNRRFAQDVLFVQQRLATILLRNQVFRWKNKRAQSINLSFILMIYIYLVSRFSITYRAARTPVILGRNPNINHNYTIRICIYLLWNNVPLVTIGSLLHFTHLKPLLHQLHLDELISYFDSDRTKISKTFWSAYRIVLYWYDLPLF